jgi:hypothetical protein
MLEGLTPPKKARPCKVRETIEALERKLAVQLIGEESVKRQEELATAVNDQERERIELLQDQILLQGELAKEKAQKESEEKTLASQLANFQMGVTGTQSRLLTRGPAEKGIDRIAKATEKTVAVLGDVVSAIATSNRRESSLRLEFVD